MGKKDLIISTLAHLQAIVGEGTPQYHGFRKLTERAAYTAPELMDNLWQRIYRFLRSEVPCQRCVVVWNEANDKFCKLGLSQ